MPVSEMNTPAEDLAPCKGAQVGREQPPLLNISAIKRWMSADISFRVARGWVIGAGLLFLSIMAIALD